MIFTKFWKKSFSYIYNLTINIHCLIETFYHFKYVFNEPFIKVMLLKMMILIRDLENLNVMVLVLRILIRKKEKIKFLKKCLVKCFCLFFLTFYEFFLNIFFNFQIK